MPALTTAMEEPDHPIRLASRQLAREWGFLRPTLAGTSLTPPAVHCLLEVGDHGIQTVPELCQVLAIDKPDLKRVLHELLATGHVLSEWIDNEQRVTITPQGLETLVAVNLRGAQLVQKALENSPPDAADRIVDGLKLYADALRAERLLSFEADLAASSAVVPQIKIVSGYVPAVLGRCMEMHMNYYTRTTTWGRVFESELSQILGGLLGRLDNPVNQVWAAVETSPMTGGSERVVGTIWLDGEIGQPGHARMRAFIVDDHLRGLGVGRRLVNEFMRYVDEIGFTEVKLDTTRGLTAARRLYEEAGFVVTEDEEREKWGATIQNMVYTWKRGSRPQVAEKS